MSLQEIRAKVRKLEIKRILILGFGTVCYAGFAVVFAVVVPRRYQQGQTIDAVVFGYWFLILIYMAYICARGLFSKRLAPDTGRKTAIESLRAFYQWKRSFNLRQLAVYCASFFVVIPLMLILKWLQRPVFPMINLAFLGIAYLVLASKTYFQFKWIAHKLQIDFDSVNALSKDDGSAS